MTTLADVLTPQGTLPTGWDSSDYALLVPSGTADLAMAAQEQNLPPGWRHRLQLVMLNGNEYLGGCADVLTEALPPHGIYRHVFQHLPTELAATVLVIPWADFEILVRPLTP